MPSFGHKGRVAAIAPELETSREYVVKGLLSYSKERLLGSLNQIRTGGPGYAESLNIGQQVARLATHQDTQVACVAVACLGLLGSKAKPFEQTLEVCLQNPVAAVRRATVEAFGRLGIYFSNIEAIKPCATDTDATVRAKFSEAVATLEATSLHKSVSELLNDPVPEVAGAAIEALGTLMSISQDLQSTYSDEVSRVLAKMLDEPKTRNAALGTLAIMGGELAPSTCISAVVTALGDTDIYTRTSAVAAIAALQTESAAAPVTKEAMPKLQEYLSSENPGIKAAAACAVAAMGDKGSSLAEAVARLLEDNAEDTSGAAFVMGNGARRPPPQMRRPKCAAVTALARINGPQYIGKVSEALNDPNWEVRLCAAEALGFLKDEAKNEVSALIGSMEDDASPVRSMCCFALGQIQSAEAVPRLADALEDPAYTVRLYAVQALGQFGEAVEEHSHEIFKLTDDTATQVRAAAVKALARLGSTGQNYAGVIAVMLDDQDPEVRAAACEALGDMGDIGRACAGEIEDLLSDLPTVRGAAIAALEGMGVFVTPLQKDWGRGRGVPNDKPPVLMPGEINLEGLGLYLGDIMQKKQDLVAGGKWVEGVL